MTLQMIVLGVTVAVTLGLSLYYFINGDQQRPHGYEAPQIPPHLIYSDPEPPQPRRRSAVKRRTPADKKCSICLEKCLKDVTTLTCNHSFHRNCIALWFVNQNTCPNCRMEPSRTPAAKKCSICFEKCLNDVKTLTCNHSFHRNCIALWFVKQKTCPNCRMEAS